MHYYEVGYWSYEEGPCYTLLHEKKYTQEEFNEIVSNCFVKAFKNGVGNKAEHLLDTVLEMLVSEHGFKDLEDDVVAKFIPFGWADLDDPKDWDTQVKDGQLNLIRDKIAREAAVK